MHIWWAWYCYFYISFVNSFEECKDTWRGDGCELFPLFNPSIPQSHRDQCEAGPIKANWFAKCFCSEGTSPIFSNKEVLGREEGIPQKARSEMKPRVLERMEWKSRGVPSERSLKPEHWSNVLEGRRRGSEKSSVHREFRKCYRTVLSSNLIRN